MLVFCIALFGFSEFLGQGPLPRLAPLVDSMDFLRFPLGAPLANTLSGRTLLGIGHVIRPWKESTPERGVGQLMSDYAHHNP